MTKTIITEKQFKGIVYRAGKKYNLGMFKVFVRTNKKGAFTFHTIISQHIETPELFNNIRKFRETASGNFEEMVIKTNIKKTVEEIKEIQTAKKVQNTETKDNRITRQVSDNKRISKKSLVLQLFIKPGNRVYIEEVLAESGFDKKNLNVFISIMKNPKRTKPEELRTFVIEDGLMTWVE